MCLVSRVVAKVLGGQLLSWWIHHGLIRGHYYCRLSGHWPKSLTANFWPDEFIMFLVSRMVARVLGGKLLSGWVHHIMIGGHYYCRLNGQSPWWSTTYLMSPPWAEWPEWWPGFLMVRHLPDESIMCWVAIIVASILSGQLFSWWVHHGLIGGHYYCRLNGQSPWWSTNYLMSPSCAEWPEWWPGFLMVSHIKWLRDKFDYGTILVFNLP